MVIELRGFFVLLFFQVGKQDGWQQNGGVRVEESRSPEEGEEKRSDVNVNGRPVVQLVAQNDE